MEPPIGPEFNLELQLPDATTPLVILLGPGDCGRTMLISRLARWLIGKGYMLEPSKFIKSMRSERIEQICNRYMDAINSDYPTQKAYGCNFMSLKVINSSGEPICQILDSPGDLFFDLLWSELPFPYFIIQLIKSTNPKTWMFIVERNWKDEKDRLNYADKIIKMLSLIEPSDRVIFTCSKSDCHPGLFNAGQPNVPQFFKDIKNQYPGIFSKYEVKNPIVRLWRKYNCDFVVFSAGAFYDTADGGLYYSPSKDLYPANLWKSIIKNLRKMNKKK